MVDLVLRSQATPGGRIALWSDWESHDKTRPVIVVAHGALRNAPALIHWATRFQGFADVVLLELPGHGRSGPIESPTVVALADHVQAAISASFPGREVTLVGESLGGLIGLDLAGRDDTGPLKAVIACDPPMTSAKLWNVQQSLQRILNDRSLTSAFTESLCETVFGISGPNISERIYYSVLDRIHLPTLIVTGDYPLFPARNMSGVACLFDHVDRYVLQTYHPGKAHFCIVPNCGHLLLVGAVEAMETVILDFMKTEISHTA